MDHRMEKIEADVRDGLPPNDFALEFYNEKKAALIPFIEALESALLSLNSVYRRNSTDLTDREKEGFHEVLTSVEAALESMNTELEGINDGS